MKRNIIISAVIGTLITYLPFWEWGGTQLFGAFALSVVAWMLIQGTEPVTKNGSCELGALQDPVSNGQKQFITLLL